jgi:hypothetical protein
MPSTFRKRSPSKGVQFWSSHIQAWKQSNLSKAEYSRQHDLPIHALRYWFKKLESKNGQQSNNAVVPLPFHLQDLASRPSSPMTLKVGQSYQVEINGDFSSTVLQKLIKTLEGLS